MANNKDFVINNPIDIAGASIETPASSTVSTTSAFNNNQKRWSYGNRDREYYDLTAISTNPNGITFKPDGTMMFVLFRGNDRIYQYDLSTPWDMSTAVPRTGTGDELWIGATNNNPQCLHFAPDGSALYVINTSGQASIQRHSLTTDWDLSTASATASATLNVGSRDLTPTGFCFNSDGSRMYLTGQENDSVFTYETASPFDPIGGSYDSNGTLALPNNTSSMTSPESIFMSPDDMHIYVGESGSIYKYDLAIAGRIGTGKFTDYDRIVVYRHDTVTQTARQRDFYYSSASGKLFIADSQTDSIYVIDVHTDITETNNIDLSQGNYFNISPSRYNDTAIVGFNNPGSVQSFQIEIEGTGYSYDIENMTLDPDNVLDFSALIGGVSYGTMAENGKHVYLGGTAEVDSTIHHWRLDTPYDLTAATLVGQETISIDGDTTANPEGLYITPDGMAYFTGQRMTSGTYSGQDVISKVELQSYPYYVAYGDISTETLKNFGTFEPKDWQFKPDGTRLFFISTAPGTKYVYQYELTTPWDITTAQNYTRNDVDDSRLNHFIGQSPSWSSFKMLPNGKGFIAYSQQGQAIARFTLGTPWDITTLDLVHVRNLAGGQGVAMSDNGDKYFTSESTGSSGLFRTYNMASRHTIQWPTNVIWKKGYAPLGPEVGEKSIYTFTTRDGGTTYFGSEVTDSTS